MKPVRSALPTEIKVVETFVATPTVYWMSRSYEQVNTVNNRKREDNGERRIQLRDQLLRLPANFVHCRRTVL